MSPDEPIEQVAYPGGVTSAEVLADLVMVRWLDDDGAVIWKGRLEDPGVGS